MDNPQADKIGHKTQMNNTDPTKKPGWGQVPAKVVPASYKTPATLLMLESGKILIGDRGRKTYVNKNERSVAIWEKRHFVGIPLDPGI